MSSGSPVKLFEDCKTDPQVQKVGAIVDVIPCKEFMVAASLFNKGKSRASQLVSMDGSSPELASTFSKTVKYDTKEPIP